MVNHTHQSVLQLGPQLDDELVGRLDGEGRRDEADVQRAAEGHEHVDCLPVVQADDGVHTFGELRADCSEGRGDERGEETRGERRQEGRGDERGEETRGWLFSRRSRVEEDYGIFALNWEKTLVKPKVKAEGNYSETQQNEKNLVSFE